jgi:hypothetical protein
MVWPNFTSFFYNLLFYVLQEELDKPKPELAIPALAGAKTEKKVR